MRNQVTMLIFAFGVCISSQVGCSSRPKPTPEKKLPDKLHLKANYEVKPWKQGTPSTAFHMFLAQTTIPLSRYSFTATKDHSRYSGVLAGTSPFASPPAGSTIEAVVVPLKVDIGSAAFDPSVPDTCDGNVSAVTRFGQSPLANDIPALTIDGIDVGNVQFINGVRRAEFWTTIGGSTSYQNELHFTYANTFELSNDTVGSHGILASTDCRQIGVLSYSWLDGMIQNTILPALASRGVVSPRATVFFLLKNVVQSDVDPPSLGRCCILGYHGAVGAPVQTYGTMDWDTSGNFDGVSDISVSSHEIAEWMDDPLGNNPTPPWGNIGQVNGCQDNWEPGDPLSGNLQPSISINGKNYQMQELGFFSWYFNSTGTPSVGAGGKFSSNGTFHGASKQCPPGGTN